MRRPAYLVAVLTCTLLGGVLAGVTSASQRTAAETSPATGHAAVTAQGTLSNDEVVVATLDPSGLPESAHLVSRLTSVDGPRRTVADPSSVTNVGYLDRLGRPEVTGEDVLLRVGGPGVNTVLTEARFDQPLPLALHAQYELDGQVVTPSQVVGSHSELTVKYTLTNTSLKQTKLKYRDAGGTRHTRSVPVFAPLTGTVLVTLPADTEVVRAPRAVRTANADGATVLQWNVALYPPLTEPIQEMEVVTRAVAAALPSVNVRMAPATNSSDPAAKFGGTLLVATMQGNAKLLGGLEDLDDGARTLADGASAVSDGVSSLAAGTSAAAAGGDRLSTGLSSLAGGAAHLAAGNHRLASALTQAADGAQKLAGGTAQLSRSVTSAGLDGVAQLRAAAKQLAAGGRALAERLGSPADPELPDPLPAADDDDRCEAGSAHSDQAGGGSAAVFEDDCVTLYQALRALGEGLTAASAAAAELNSQLVAAGQAKGSLTAGITETATQAGAAATGAEALLAEACNSAALQFSVEQCAALQKIAAAAEAARQAAAGTTTPLAALDAAMSTATACLQTIEFGLSESVATVDQLLAGIAAISAALASGDISGMGLSGGLDALVSGLSQLHDGLVTNLNQLTTALQGVSDGSSRLASGVAAAALGASTLAAGADQLAAGGAQAADGANQLAAGISALANGAGQAAGGAADLVGGAHTLQQAGTAKLADSVLNASTDPALGHAWLVAAGKRAAHSMPYGPPEGATGQVVYLLDLPGRQPPAGGLWGRIKDLLGG
ncbi:MAG: hypothetical protein ACOYEV_10740 [Candidatus Nanopelagicales bacterium]